jgi:hypothetical protein
VLVDFTGVPDGTSPDSIPSRIQYRTFEGFRNTIWDISDWDDQSKTSVKAKMTVYGVTHVRAFADLGVTVEEYASYLGKFSEMLADYVGLEYKQILEGDWIVFTVTEKK